MLTSQCFLSPPNGTNNIASSDSMAGPCAKYSECMISLNYQKFWEVSTIIIYLLWEGGKYGG